MSKQISALSIALFASVGPFSAGLKKAEEASGHFVDRVKEAGSRLLELTGIAAAVGAAMEAVFEIKKSFEVAGQIETANVQLTALTGNASQAKAMMDGLLEFSAKSPFNTQDLIDSSKRLLAVGVSAQSIMPMMHQIGDVAAGTGRNITEIADTFVRVGAEGKLSSRELLEFGRSGVPIVEELARQFHTTRDGVAQLAKDGKLGFNELESAFAAMTEPGGRFSGIMEAQAATMSGRWKTLSESVEVGGATIFESISKAFNLGGAMASASRAFDSISASIAGFIDRAAPMIQRIGGEVIGVFSRIGSAVEPYIMPVWHVVEGVFQGIVNVVVSTGQGILAASSGIWSQIYGIIGPIVSAIYQLVAENFTGIVETVIGLGLSVYNALLGAMQGALSIVQMAWNGIVAVWSWASDWITGRTTTAGQETNKAFNDIGAIFKWLADFATTSFNILGYALSHLQDTVALVAVGAAYDFVRFGNQIAYICTDVAWGTIKWLWTNLVAFGSAAATIFENLGKNILAVFSNLPGLISGKTKWADIWKPMTDGMTATFQAVPKIAARQEGDMELSLKDKLDALQQAYGDGLGKYMAEQDQKSKDAAKAFTDPIKNALKPPPIAAPKIDKPTVPKPDPLKIAVTPQLTQNNLTVAVTPEVHHAKAIFSGSAESLAARYHAPMLDVATTYSGNHAAPLPAVGGNLAPAIAQAVVPPVSATTPTANTPSPAPALQPAPTVATTDATGHDAQELLKAMADKQLTEMKAANVWLYKIETNTRTVPAATVVNI